MFLFIRDFIDTFRLKPSGYFALAIALLTIAHVLYSATCFYFHTIKMILWQAIKLILALFFLCSVCFGGVHSAENVTCGDYPFFAQGSVLMAHSNCYDSAFSSGCPFLPSVAFASFGGQECYYKNCSRQDPITGKIVISENSAAWLTDETAVTLKGEKMTFKNKNKVKGQAWIGEITYAYCIKEETAVLLTNGTFNGVAEHFKVCCGPFCSEYKRGEVLAGPQKFCSRLDVILPGSPPKKIVIFNTSPEACGEMSCFFCKEVFIHASCHDMTYWILWGVLSCSGGVVIGLLLRLKYRLYQSLVRMRRRADFNRVEMDDFNGRGADAGALLKGLLISAMLPGVLGCSNVFDMTSSVNGKVVVSKFQESFSLGKEFCFSSPETTARYSITLNEMWTEYSAKWIYDSVDGPFHWEHQSTQLWRSFDDYNSCWRNKKGSERTFVARSQSKKLTALHDVHMYTRVPFFGVYKLTPVKNYGVIKVVDRTGYSVDVVASEDVSHSNDITTELVSVSLPWHQKYAVLMAGSWYMVKDEKVSLKGLPVAGTIGDIQCDAESSEWTYCTMDYSKVPQLSYYSCQDEHPFAFLQEGICEKYVSSISNLIPLPNIGEEGSFVFQGSLRASHTVGNMGILFSIKGPVIPFEDQGNCKVTSIRLKGLSSQTDGAHVMIETDSSVGVVEVKLDAVEIHCHPKKNHCHRITTFREQPIKASWICGNNNGTLKVEGDLKRGVDVQNFMANWIDPSSPNFNLNTAWNSFSLFQSWQTYAVYALCAILVLRLLRI